MCLAAFILVFAIFFADVVVGALGYSAFLSGLGEMPITAVSVSLTDNIGMNENSTSIGMIAALGVGFMAPSLGLNLFKVSRQTGERNLKIAGRRILCHLQVQPRVADRLCVRHLDQLAVRNLPIESPTRCHANI